LHNTKEKSIVLLGLLPKLDFCQSTLPELGLARQCRNDLLEFAHGHVFRFLAKQMSKKLFRVSINLIVALSGCGGGPSTLEFPAFLRRRSRLVTKVSGTCGDLTDCSAVLIVGTGECGVLFVVGFAIAVVEVLKPAMK